LDDVIGEPEVDEHGGETIHEPSHPGDCPAVDYFVGLRVKCTVQGDDRQISGPDSLRRIDEEPPCHSSDTIANEVVERATRTGDSGGS